MSADLPHGASPAAIADPLFASRAIAVAAREAGATPSQLLSHWKAPPELVMGRFAVMHALARRGLGVTAIGRRVRRDHSTIGYGLRRARELLATDADFADLFAKVDAA